MVLLPIQERPPFVDAEPLVEPVVLVILRFYFAGETEGAVRGGGLEVGDDFSREGVECEDALCVRD